MDFLKKNSWSGAENKEYGVELGYGRSAAKGDEGGGCNT